MKARYFITTVLLLFGSLFARDALKTDVPVADVVNDLEKYLPELMENANTPGLSVALIRDGKLAWTKGFGVINTESGQPVTNNTIFDAASLSKPLFSYAVLRFAQEGKFDIDTPLSDYLPEKYTDDERLSQITARIVMSHRSGFPNWRPRGGELEIHFTPGEKFSYSGEGFVYLSKVIEHLAGKPMHEFVREYAFQPLEMSESSFIWEDRYKDRIAFGHTMSGKPIDLRQDSEGNAAASLRTTAGDYAKFMLAVINKQGLPGKVFDEILTPAVNLNPDCVVCTSNSSDERSSSLGWGLGWGLQKTADGNAFWHWGDNGVYKCYIVAYPEKKIGVVFFTNSSDGMSLRQDLVSRAIGGTHPAFDWADYETYDSPSMQLRQFVLKKGAAAGIAKYRSMRETKTPEEIGVTERGINRLGYVLLGQDRIDEAIELFKLNTEEYPESWNVYDSLAEAYMKKEEKELAIKFYKKSIELNPDNSHGKDMLKKLMEE